MAIYPKPGGPACMPGGYSLHANFRERWKDELLRTPSRRSSALPRSTALGLSGATSPTSDRGIGPNCVLRLAHFVRPWTRDRSSSALRILGWCATRRDLGGGRRVVYFLFSLRRNHSFEVCTLARLGTTI